MYKYVAIPWLGYNYFRAPTREKGFLLLTVVSNVKNYYSAD